MMYHVHTVDLAGDSLRGTRTYAAKRPASRLYADRSRNLRSLLPLAHPRIIGRSASEPRFVSGHTFLQRKLRRPTRGGSRPRKLRSLRGTGDCACVGVRVTVNAFGALCQGPLNNMLAGPHLGRVSKNGKSLESRKSCKTAPSNNRLVLANSGKRVDGKEGVAGSSPAEGSRSKSLLVRGF